MGEVSNRNADDDRDPPMGAGGNAPESHGGVPWPGFWEAYEAERYAVCWELMKDDRDVNAEPFFRYLRGEILRRLRRLPEAESVLRECRYEGASFEDLASCSLAEIYLETGRVDLAEALLRRVVRTARRGHEPFVLLAIILLNRGDRGAAAAVLEAALPVVKYGQAELHLYLARVRRADGKCDEAAGEYAEAVRLEPTFEVARRERDDLLEAMRVRAKRAAK